MHILITGISGQIGRRLGEMLTEEGVSHRGVDANPFHGPVPFLRWDLTRPLDKIKGKGFFEPVSHVIHLAAKMSNSVEFGAEWAEQFRVNVLGTLNLLKAMGKRECHFSFASSMTVYGAPIRLPVKEDDPVRPENLYALGKLAVERVLAMYAMTRGIPVAILRYSSVYGPGSISHRAVPSMIQRALGGHPPKVNGTGKTARDYVYIDDVCRATIKASQSRASGIFNVGSGKGTSVTELAGEILRQTLPEREAEYDPSKPDGYSLYYDIRKMREELEFKPEVGLQEGIERTVQWHRNQRTTP